MTKRIAIYCSPRSLMSSIGNMADAFTLINNFTTRALNREEIPPTSSVHFVSKSGGTLALLGGLAKLTTEKISSDKMFDAIILPANDMTGESIKQLLDVDQQLIAWLVGNYERGAWLAASGQSVAVLAAAEALPLGTVAAPWWLQAPLQQRYGQLRLSGDQPISQSARIVSCANLSAEFEMTRRLIEGVLTARPARWWSGVTGHLAGRDVDPFPGSAPETDGDMTIIQLRLWLEESPFQEVSLERLAKLTGLGERTLVRRFKALTGKTPHAYVQDIRVEVSKNMLIRTNRNVERIANLVGYSDTRYFRNLFRERTGMSPSQFRNASRDHPYFGTA